MKKWLIPVFLLGIIPFFFHRQEEQVFRGDGMIPIRVLDGPLTVVLSSAQMRTVGDALDGADLIIGEHDRVFPEKETQIYAGMTIHLVRAHEFRAIVDGGERIFWSEARSVEEALLWEGIHLDEDDILKPARETLPSSSQTKVLVTRVEIREESKEIRVPFETEVGEDRKLSWRKRIVTRKGEYGIKKTLYRVAYHDGKEVSRKLLRTEEVKEPEAELVTQGTFVQTGKSHRGAASWYAYTGTMAAANPWLPKGSHVRVTNTDNGKSVIVVINDRGPFAPGRIIDLDKVAFEKIASLGAGVINVKMEEITN